MTPAMSESRAKLAVTLGSVASIVAWTIFFVLIYATSVGSYIGLSLFFFVVAMCVTLPTGLLLTALIVQWLEESEDEKQTKRSN